MTETTRIERINTVPGMGRALIEHDPRSKGYPARGVVMRSGITRVTKSWRRAGVYTQGKSNTCVGQTFRGVLNSSPLSAAIPLAKRKLYPAQKIYDGAQANDQWPGAEPDYSGTSALGAMAYLKQDGVIKEYRWCFGLDDVLDTLSQYGPVGVGVWWHEGMMDTDANGFIKPSGDKVGGHEVELVGINVPGRFVVGANSWGPDWGTFNGRFKLAWEDLGTLLADDGDSVTVTSV